MTSPRIEHLLTTGMIGAGRPDLPPEGITLENNVWLLGNDHEVLIIDAAHEANTIAEAVGTRDPLGIVLTHGHEDHINAAVDLAAQLDTHVYLHPADLFLWEQVHRTSVPDFELTPGAHFSVGGSQLEVVHTPGHTPGSISLVARELGAVFSGDTLFQGGPGATQWEYSSFPLILASIEDQLLTLPGTTVVHTGHGPHTSIAAEAADVDTWKARGW